VRRTEAWIFIALASALGACGRSDTGVHIFARAGSLEYDELQFAVTSAGGELIVDPATMGRYQGPFQPGDQDVLVLLRDDVAGSQLHCEASALRGGAVVSAGAHDVTVVRGEIQNVEIFMAPGTGGGGGTTGGGGDTGGGGTGGGGMPGKPNGEACSLGSECLTGHCADGACCESDCNMACHSCALADSRGLCRPVAGDTQDPHGMCNDQGPASCKNTGLCGVDGTCAVYPAGTACAAAGCMGGTAVLPARTCNGAGKCEGPAKIECPDNTSCVAGLCTGV